MINIRELEKTFGTRRILKKLCLQVGKGTVYGLIGKNGAGKTTLINIIAGLSDASSGDCYIAGEKMKKGKNIGTKIGYLPDIPRFFDYLSTGEYLDFLLQGLNKKERINKKKELLELVHLGDGIKISTMSRGMKQRLGIAATLANNPDIILLDEPTSALDPLGRNELIQIINALKKEHKRIILSTHILTDMQKVCDEVGFLHDGVIQKNISIKQMEAQESAFRILFNDFFEVKVYDSNRLNIKKVSPNEFVFKLNDNDLLENQKYLFEYLSKSECLVSRVKKEVQSLDDIFEEVCRK